MGDLEQADAVFQNYTSYYSNRVNRPGGGAAVFILNSIISEPMTNLTVNLPHIEAVFVRVTLPNKTVIVSSIYRSPNTKFGEFRTYIGISLLPVNWYASDIIICGGFNWDLLRVNESSNHACTVYINSKAMAYYLPCLSQLI